MRKYSEKACVCVHCCFCLSVLNCTLYIMTRRRLTQARTHDVNSKSLNKRTASNKRKKVRLDPLIDAWQPNPIDLATIANIDSQTSTNDSSLPTRSLSNGSKIHNLKINDRLSLFSKQELLDKCIKQVTDGSPTPRFTELAKEWRQQAGSA